ncbi:hypothetical protein OIO90_006185 [Microbotryomycetes sp. JL221]|nr:hypothetical protein OIO90_006185 [Microbotryomycetes sp. JL221]
MTFGASPMSPTSSLSSPTSPLNRATSSTRHYGAARGHLHKRTLSTSTRIFVGAPTTPPSKSSSSKHHLYKPVAPDSPTTTTSTSATRRRTTHHRIESSINPLTRRSGKSTTTTATATKIIVWIVMSTCVIVAIVQLVTHGPFAFATTTNWRAQHELEPGTLTEFNVALNNTRNTVDNAHAGPAHLVRPIAQTSQVAVPDAQNADASTETAAATVSQESDAQSTNISKPKVKETRPKQPTTAIAAPIYESPDSSHTPIPVADKYLFVAWMGEQETKAQAHLYQLGLLAFALNRTLVLPQVKHSRFGACYRNDFSLYYEQDTLHTFGIPYSTHGQFLDWLQQPTNQFKRTAQMIALTRGNPRPEDVAFMPLNSMCINELPNIDLSTYAPRAFFSPHTDWKSDDVRLKFGQKVVKTLTRQAKLDDDRGPDVLIVQYDLRFPFLTPAIVDEFNLDPTRRLPSPYHYFQYSNFWTKLGQQYSSKLSPYVAVHWRTETLNVENLVECGSNLIHLLKQIKQDQPQIEMVYLATDYPLEGLGKHGQGKGSMIAHSGTMNKLLTQEHHDAMRSFLGEFESTFGSKPKQQQQQHGSKQDKRSTLRWTSFNEMQKQVELSEELKAILPMIESKHRQLSLQELDHAIVGIVDKVVLTNAQIFLAGQYITTTDFSRRCAKHSQFTEQVVTGRKQLLNDMASTNKDSSRQQELIKLWNTVNHFAMDEQDQDYNKPRLN